MTWFCEVMNTVFKFGANERIVANYDNIEVLQADFKVKADTAKVLVDSKIISTQAARTELGYSENDAPTTTTTDGQG
jgi:hypothetical protein